MTVVGWKLLPLLVACSNEPTDADQACHEASSADCCGRCPCFTPFHGIFAANIRNLHTRRAYARAVKDFLAWCEDTGVRSIAQVQRLHVAAWVELQTRGHAAPTAKQRLAAVRLLFDWLVTGQIVPVNPAASVRGPRHFVKSGNALRQLLDQKRAMNK